MTVAEIAKQLGKSHQAVYKKISNAGLRISDLRDASTGQLTPEGVEAIRALYSPSAGATEVAQSVEKPVAEVAAEVAQSVEKEVETVEKPVAEVETELARLQTEVAELKHRAELAEVKAAAAENERDYLRQQLDASIKAAALASVRRLTAPEDEQPTQAPAGLRTRIKAAWAALRNK